MMITIKENGQQLECFYNGQIIFKHHQIRPVFALGKGTEKILGFRGNYEIEDKVNLKIDLIHYRVNHHTIVFYNNDVELEVQLTVKEERLQMTFHAPKEYNRFWIRLEANEDEKVYGCGIQPSYLNLRSRKYPLFTSESGVGRDPKSQTTQHANSLDRSGGDYYTTYYPETTFVSSRKYWLHASTYAYAEFDFTNLDEHMLYFHQAPNEILISFQTSYLNLIADLTSFTKRPPILPSYVEDGIILGVQGGFSQVLSYLDKAKSKDVKVAAIWCQDWAGIRYTSFGKRLHWNWVTNDQLYPNLKEEIARLKLEGIAFLGYINPFLLENESLFIEAKQNNYLVLNVKGEAYIEDFGEFYCGIVDLTNAQAFEWYKQVIQKNLIDQGMKGWMADFGEYLPIDCVLSNGVDAKLMHNEWPVLWAKCNYEAISDHDSLEEVFYFMRAGGHLSQKYATALWAGRCVNF
jgi:sulfoquinovosidase